MRGDSHGETRAAETAASVRQRGEVSVALLRGRAAWWARASSRAGSRGLLLLCQGLGGQGGPLQAREWLFLIPGTDGYGCCLDVDGGRGRGCGAGRSSSRLDLVVMGEVGRSAAPRRD